MAGRYCDVSVGVGGGDGWGQVSAGREQVKVNIVWVDNGVVVVGVWAWVRACTCSGCTHVVVDI